MRFGILNTKMFDESHSENKGKNKIFRYRNEIFIKRIEDTILLEIRQKIVTVIKYQEKMIHQYASQKLAKV